MREDEHEKFYLFEEQKVSSLDKKGIGKSFFSRRKEEGHQLLRGGKEPTHRG